jgi:AcrR family transcriptional regulator
VNVSSVESEPRRLRADAERNRRRLLDSAAELFAAKGLGVGLDEIARHAGVGVGTVYRRFPDKDALIDGLFEDRIEELAQLGELALADDDAWGGLVGFMEGAVRMHAADRGLKEIVFGLAKADHMREARARIEPLIERLVARAQETGELRPDLAPTDIAVLQFMLSGVADLHRPDDPEQWPRCLAIVLDGLRGPGAHELPGRALTPAELQDAVRRAK